MRDKLVLPMGMFPDNLLRERSNASRYESFPKEEGMLPLSMLLDKLSKTRPVKSPITTEISPQNLLLERSMAMK